MADDRLPALEEIKRHHRQHVSVNHPAPGICVSRCAGKWPCQAYRGAAALDAVLKLADGARDAASFPPADCTNSCSDGPCDCSGKWRAAAWSLDPAEVRAVITRELTGEVDDEH